MCGSYICTSPQNRHYGHATASFGNKSRNPLYAIIIVWIRPNL